MVLESLQASRSVSSTAGGIGSLARSC
ncbi:hypothetical protein [Bradyrhizobium arachidis]